MESTSFFLLQLKDLDPVTLVYCTDTGTPREDIFLQDPVVMLQEAAPQSHLNDLWFAAQGPYLPG